MKSKFVSFFAGLFLAAISASALAQTSTLPITSLPTAATPLGGAEYFSLVQSGATRKAKISDITDLIEELSGIYSVTDYMTAEQKADIATGSPTLDLKTAIQSAENAMGAKGGTLYFPPGVYRHDSIVHLSSNVHVKCAGRGAAVFKPIYNFTMFSNDVIASRDPTNDTTAVTEANQPDHNISVEGCTFDMRAATGAASPSPAFAGDVATPVRFYYARDVRVEDSEIIGLDDPVLSGGSWIGSTGAFITQGVTGGRFIGNKVTGTLIGFDHWQGSNNLEIAGNIIVNSNNETAHRANGYCIGVNGRGSLPNDHKTAFNITIKNNYCTAGGWGTGGIQFEPLSAGSQTNKITIDSNVVVGRSGGTNQQGIYARGVVNDVTIANNKVEGINNLPILVSDNFSTGGPFTCTDCITTTNGSSSVVVAISTLTDTRVVVGNYLLFSSGTGAVGGITFASKYFVVTAVNSGVSVTVTADAAASSSATGGGAVSTNVYWGAPNRVAISGNSLLNASYPNNALINCIGQNCRIGGNSATGGTYGALSFASSIVAGAVTTPLPAVWGSQAPAGSGIAGSGGNNIDNYPPQRHPVTPFPSIIIPHGASPFNVVDGEIWTELSLGLRARVGGSSRTYADLSSAQTLTGAKLFTRAKLADQGQCTMTAGACSAQSLGSTYAAAPLCSLTWTGAGTLNGKLKVASTTTTVTPSSTDGADTAQVNWTCFGN